MKIQANESVYLRYKETSAINQEECTVKSKKDDGALKSFKWL